MLAETVATIDGTIILRLERDFGLLAAVSASHCEHLATFDAVTAALTFAAAIATTHGLILETFLRVEFLFARTENKFFSAVLAYEGFVFKSHQKNLLTKKKILTFDTELALPNQYAGNYITVYEKSKTVSRLTITAQKFIINRAVNIEFTEVKNYANDGSQQVRYHRR